MNSSCMMAGPFLPWATSARISVSRGVRRAWLGQLGRPLVAPQLFRGLLHKAARIQDAHAPAARQFLLGQQDERGRQHHGHHRNRDDRVLGAGVHAGRDHGLGDPLAPDDEHLLGAFDGGEDDDRDPERFEMSYRSSATIMPTSE